MRGEREHYERFRDMECGPFCGTKVHETTCECAALQFWQEKLETYCEYKRIQNAAISYLFDATELCYGIFRLKALIQPHVTLSENQQLLCERQGGLGTEWKRENFCLLQVGLQSIANCELRGVRDSIGARLSLHPTHAEDVPCIFLYS